MMNDLHCNRDGKTDTASVSNFLSQPSQLSQAPCPPVEGDVSGGAAQCG
jgi:hypothetical protein